MILKLLGQIPLYNQVSDGTPVCCCADMDPLPAGIGIVTESLIEIGIVTAEGDLGRMTTGTTSATGTECASLSAPAERCQP